MQKETKENQNKKKKTKLQTKFPTKQHNFQTPVKPKRQ
jgi:hypothetical protein